MTASHIDHWFGRLTLPQFAAEYFHKLPYSQSAAAVDLGQDCGWSLLTRILEERDADVMVARSNRQYDGPQPRDPQQAAALSDQGYTILVRHAERHDSRLSELAAAFRSAFGGEVNIHMYATPAEEFGFGWHYDAEDVFILQTEGRKEYALRKNTVNPWPLVETIPADMQYQRELMPMMRVLLAAGDLLYIPPGYWHYGKAEARAVSLAIGVMSPAAINVLDEMRSELVQSLLWRQRLPVRGAARTADEAQLREQYRAILSELANDLQRRLQDEALLDRLLSQS